MVSYTQRQHHAFAYDNGLLARQTDVLGARIVTCIVSTTTKYYSTAGFGTHVLVPHSYGDLGEIG